MNKEKLHIPMPTDEIMQKEIQTIIAAGMKRRESFPSFMFNLYRDIGFRYLFTNIKEGMLLTFSGMFVLIYLFVVVADSSSVSDKNIYAFIFLASPLLYMLLSIYDFLEKKQRATYEVEMVTKYNYYQIAGFRMLNFSIIAIFVNTISIMSLVRTYENMEFFRSFLLSMTSLFLFSILFLLAFIKKRSGFTVVIVSASWVGANIGMSYFHHQMYLSFLITGPLIVYVFVLTISLIVYLIYLSKLVRFKPAEGAL